MSGIREYWLWPMWIYRSSTAQANAAGGAIVLTFKPADGDTMLLISAIGVNSGTNSLRMERLDEDDNRAFMYVDVGSGAGSAATLPRAKIEATSSQIGDSTPLETRLIRGDDYFSIRQLGAGAQNDTLIVAIRALLPDHVAPVISKAESTNQANVTITETVNKVI